MHSRNWISGCLPLAICAGILLSGCAEDELLLRAKQVENQHELIGGPLAHGEVGDYLIENDQVRFIISGAHHSWGPGLLGGTVVDADLRRNELQFRGGRGKDQFSELFPTVNLLVADPSVAEIRVLNDGKDGKEAAIEVTGRGSFYIDAMSFLDATKETSYSFFLQSQNLMAILDFATVYRLHPGTRSLEIVTTIRRPQHAVAMQGCDEQLKDCPLECEHGFRTDADSQCLKCECDEPMAMPLFTEPVPLLGRILGDALGYIYEGPDAFRAGAVGGDFLFFGGKTNIFAPGLGFDEKKMVFDNLYRGVDTVTSPLTFDWVASAGKDVSYAYYTKRESDVDPSSCNRRIVLKRLLDPDNQQELTDLLISEFSKNANRIAQPVVDLVKQRVPLVVRAGVAIADVEANKADIEAIIGHLATVGVEMDGDCRDPKLLVPLFTSSATMVASAGISCLLNDPSDDTYCDERRILSFKRYLAVGDGDVASAAAEVFKAQNIPTGTVRGVVFDKQTGKAAFRAEVFVLYDPDPNTEFATYRDVVAANFETTLKPGLYNHTRADVGTDPGYFGRFKIELPKGSWILVARSTDGVIGHPLRITVAAGSLTIANPLVDSPAILEYRVLDANGASTPAKLTLQAMNGDQALYGDGKRPVEMGDGRMDDGIYKVIYSHKGEGSESLEAGRYTITASRGFEYSIDTRVVDLKPGQVTVLDAVITHEMDTSGYISGDFHLHAEPSLDSGMSLAKRVVTNILEGVELLSSSDHDVVTDYAPTLRELGLDHLAKTQVGLEVSSLELGHFLGFPLQYDHNDKPVHGAIDWVCKTHHEIFEEIRDLGAHSPSETMIAVAHPRDGFLGYFDQFGLTPFDLQRGDAGLESWNPLFKTISCDFDAMEVLNGKRFELIRTPTISEVKETERCFDEINDANTQSAMREACQHLQAPTECDKDDSMRFGEPCQWYAWMAEEFADCSNETDLILCKDKIRNAVSLLAVRRMMMRTPEEQNQWHSVCRDETTGERLCTANALEKMTNRCQKAAPEDAQFPCVEHKGVLDDWFQLLNHGLNITAMGNSDSHGTGLEPGIPRNWIASKSDDPALIDSREIAQNLKAHRSIASTGPFVRASINGATFGDTVAAPATGDIKLQLQIQTASWFGVSRIEIYRNGHLEKAIDINKDVSAIVDFDELVSLPRPSEDSWYVVTVMGLRPQDFLSPVYITVPLGELTLAKIISLALGNLPLVAVALGTSSQVPDFFPPIPYALTNPIWVDVDGGGFKSMYERPPFCPTACQIANDEDGNPAQSDCPISDQVCHSKTSVGMQGDGGICGVKIAGECSIGDKKSIQSALKLNAKKPKASFLTPEKPETLSRTIMRRIWNAFRHAH